MRTGTRGRARAHRREPEALHVPVPAAACRLQERVPETIANLRRAGINIWMLTGDKLSTALEIALSANLRSVSSRSRLLPVEGKSHQDVVNSVTYNLEVASREKPVDKDDEQPVRVCSGH